jgi:amino acid adenylation domain-containing protein
MPREDELAARRSKLSPAQLALLEKRLRGSASSVIPRRVERDSAPLSFDQQRLWFLDQLEPGNPAYNRPVTLHLRGSLHVGVLERALNEIVRRHEILRTTFPASEGRPAQMIHPFQPLALRVTDLSNLSEAEREVQALRLMSHESQRSFDLAQGPLFCPTLFRLSEQEHILLLAMHHIVFDGWSVRVLLRELATLYEAFAANKPSPLPELPIQYADFAHWQRRWLQGDVLEKQLAYWKERLASSPPLLGLPMDRPRPPLQTHRGARQSLVLSQALTDALKALFRQEEVTPFMTLLAAFQVLLHRYTGQDDILVGSPIAGRNWVEVEELIGLFTNTLLLRANLSGNPTFRDLLGRVRRMCLEAYAHQDLPFEKLIEELRPGRSLSRTPLFQVLFQLRNIPKETVEIQGLRIQEFQSSRESAMVDLYLEIIEQEGGFHCFFSYNTDLFEQATIRRMIGHFQTLLEGIVANPEQRIGKLPLLAEAERRQLLVEWNNTQRDYPKDACVHQLVEAQVERTPDAVAVVFEGEQLTYRELNRRANQWAHYLKNQGVGPEVLVGIFVERSLEMIVGLLGILKAGGAYVPLDPAYPKDRLAFMMEDAQVTVLLTQQRLVECLPEHRAKVVCLDTDGEAFAQENEENPVCGVTADHLAYVIYTSGSTGHPKGVMIPHRGVCNFLFWRQEYFPLSEEDRLLQNTSMSFDDSVWQIFEPLMVGARLILARPSGEQDSAYLIRLICDQSITAACFVPSMLQVFLEEPGVEQCTCLRRVSTGGEVLSPQLQERFFSRFTSNLYNGYGPTEATVAVTYWTCQRGDHRRVIPIGRPIANTQIYILDRYLNPVPIGVPGELYIGGVGLARGYLQRPELTAEKFVPHPFCDEPGTRLYKTGDLARYLDDGNIEFLGRLDHQVKIRGFRMELGEMESVLQQHPAVREAVVIAREDQPGDKRLVAYVVSSQQPPPTIHELRRFLRETLPEYMMPSTFVILDALPLTPIGKVDRQVLLTSELEHPKPGGTFQTPRSPMEKQMAQIWQEVLAIDQVGLYDNFFDLGGTSLLALQVIARVEKQWDVRLNPREMVLQTLGQLASSCQGRVQLRRSVKPGSIAHG